MPYSPFLPHGYMEKKAVKMNKTITVLLLLFFAVSAQENSLSWERKIDNKSNDTESSIKKEVKEVMEYDFIIIKVINSALVDPYQFVSSGKIKTLITLLKNDVKTVMPIALYDSLIATKINAMKIHKSYHDRCVLNIIRYSRERNYNNNVARQSLYAAALLALRRIDDPKLALSLYELAQASGYGGAAELAEKTRNYVTHEHHYTALLKTFPNSKDYTKRLDYITQLQNILDKNPQSLLALNFSIRIGDMYYRMEKYKPMIRWYQKALKIDSTIAKETSLGYRMERGKNILLRRSILRGIYIMYGIVLLIFITTLFRLNKFHGTLFFRRIVLAVPIFIIIAVVTLLLDFKITSGAIVSTLVSAKVSSVEPIVAFTVLDLSCIKEIKIIFLLGFLPILLSIVYTSFKNNYFNKLLFILLPLTILSTWSHYIINRVYDEKLSALVPVTKSHIYFDGEMENLLKSNPEKVFKANPNLLKCNNKTLEAFIKMNNPQLLNK